MMLWHLAQEWHDVLFLHWPVSPESLRQAVPDPLRIDLRDGRAWVTVLPFAMHRLRVCGLPPVPWLSSFPQLNIRTYVTLRDRPGVLLLRVIVGNRLTAAIARSLFHLPFEWGRLRLKGDDRRFEFVCRADTGRSPLAIAVVSQPAGPASQPVAGALEHWLTERFCYYTVRRDGRVERGDLDHPPWSLQPASVEILENAWPAGWGIAGAPSLTLYSKRQKAVSWLPRPAG